MNHFFVKKALLLSVFFCFQSAPAIGLFPSYTGRTTVTIGGQTNVYALGTWDSFTSIHGQDLGDIPYFDSIEFDNFQSIGGSNGPVTTIDVDVEARFYLTGNAPPAYEPIDLNNTGALMGGIHFTNPTGKITLAANIPPGNYTADFRIRVRCSNGSTFIVARNTDDDPWSVTFTKLTQPPAELEFKSFNGNDFLLISNQDDPAQDLNRDFTTQDQVFIKWEIVNRGSLPSVGNQELVIEINGQDVNTRTLGVINAGEGPSLTDNLGSFPPGTHTIRYKIVGTQTGNPDIVSETITVRAPDFQTRTLINGNDGTSDLVVDSTTDLFLSFFIQNLGTLDVSGDVVMRLEQFDRSDDSLLDSADFPITGGINVGFESGFSDVLLGTLSVGEYRFVFTSDPENQFVETDESNNSLTINVNVLDPSADNDNDTLPNAWEIANGLDPHSVADAFLDFDDDKTPNWLEFRSGLDPNDASSRIQATVRPGAAGHEFVISPVGVNVLYEFYETSDFSMWNPLPSLHFTSTATSAENVTTLPASSGDRNFYRVKITGLGLPPQP